MKTSRRSFLKSTGLGLLALGLPPSFLLRAAEAKANGRGKTLVVIFQRGGIDGLNVVIPFKDSSYYALRPSIAIPEPAAGDERAIDLDGFYGLHPALAPLKEFYDRKQLAIVHAAGSPDNTRSHFDAQDYMELGTPGIKSTPDGWLNRSLDNGDSTVNPLRAVALTPATPRMLAGANPTLTLFAIEQFKLRASKHAAPLRRLYASSKDPLLRSASGSLFTTISSLESVTEKLPASSATYPNGRFAASLKEIARLIKGGVGMEIAFTEIGGWDTHANEGGATGQLANRLTLFAEGLAAFYRDLGDRMNDVILVTMSEFGRTARENGNRGTDHGHANIMFVLGGNVLGGRVYGRWPGLAPELLNDGRDLALTTDYRSLCSEILTKHLGRSDLSKTFPNFRAAAPLGVIA